MNDKNLGKLNKCGLTVIPRISFLGGVGMRDKIHLSRVGLEPTYAHNDLVLEKLSKFPNH